ncbi:ATP-dependent helicase HrpB [Paraglaciecola marina]|uniref:ATP-dependent helicase HrpB n=1 Tax=Paraglaciecola marina TaxID=2500157 RepID=UPI0010601F02|nr:ATP-dependent helicase HrpB [Paraglaciecola marina]
MLPVEHILPALHQQLITGDAIVVAPPGAGKSTCLPLSLLKLEQCKDKKIILLQPRRIAVRTIAAYLSSQLGEAVGQTVGYRIRGDVKVSSNTRLEIVTEGILTRLLQSQPELPDIGLIIFDEFHERSVHADFSLALCIEVQQALRDDLRLLVMSATLDVAALNKLLPEAKLLESQGKSYPVDVVYRADNTKQPLFEKISRLVIEVTPKHDFDCLVFLPGVADINQAAAKLRSHFGAEIEVLTLYSELPKQEQQKALQPHPDDKRKIILATNIAETSLTIEGIQVVVDSGVEKKAVFQLSRGITHLQNQNISQASATQRAGRAGRLTAGTCYRLWSRELHDRLPKQSTPDILVTDMSQFILESAIWGSTIQELGLIDQPSEAQIKQGTDLLLHLGALDAGLRVTGLGKDIHKLGCHAGVANMLLKSADISASHQSLACAIAALLESKDPLRGETSAQVSQRIEFIHRNRSHAIWQTIKYWHKRVACRIDNTWPFYDIGLLLSFAFPQWIGFRTSDKRYLLANGAGVQLREGDILTSHKWIVLGSMFSTDKTTGDAKISLAEGISFEQIKQHHGDLIQWTEKVTWNESRSSIVAERIQTLGAITITKQNLPKPSPPEVLAIWKEVIQLKGVMSLPFDDYALQLIQRVKLAKKVMPKVDWPDFTEEGLTASLQSWLLPYISEVYTWQQLGKQKFNEMLSSMMGWTTLNTLKQLMPERYKVPSGSHIQLNYLTDGQVKISVRMQEVYGLADTPKIGNGRIPLNLELLSPAGRPLQTTQDLAGFWQGSYREVQKEMKGRYQKHFWPDDPANSQATTRTKKKMNNLN